MAAFTDIADADLVRTLAEKQHALVTARFAHSMSRLENTSTLRVIRRDIARLKTELRKRELAAGLGRDALLAQHAVAPEVARGGSSEEGASGGFLAGVVDKLGA